MKQKKLTKATKTVIKVILIGVLGTLVIRLAIRILEVL